MSAWTRKDGLLHVEGVAASAIADAAGTPVYVYSAGALRDRYRRYEAAFTAVPHLVCYSVKANSNLSVLRLFAELGSGFDIVSGGELYRVLRAGADASKVVFAGLGKTRDEILYALREGIRMFNVESPAELDLLNEVAAAAGMRAPVALRVNPDVDPKTHPYISTGMKKSKFGIAIDRAVDEYERARNLGNLDVVGVDCHIGSQLTDVTPFGDAMARVKSLVEELRRRDFEVRYVDFGGGLGIRYDDESPPSEAEYAAQIVPAIRELGVTLLLEPGRSMVGDAGAFLTRVLYRKDSEVKRFVVVDGAMNDLIRPALYDAYQHIEPVEAPRGETEVVDVVGPVCESGDFLARDRELPVVEPGELLCVRSAGAYGFVMASNYNSRPRPAEVLVDGDEWRVVRERETLEDLVRGEEAAAGA